MILDSMVPEKKKIICSCGHAEFTGSTQIFKGYFTHLKNVLSGTLQTQSGIAALVCIFLFFQGHFYNS